MLNLLKCRKCIESKNLQRMSDWKTFTIEQPLNKFGHTTFTKKKRNKIFTSQKQKEIIQNPSKPDHLFRKVRGRKGVKEIERKRKIGKIVRKAKFYPLSILIRVSHFHKIEHKNRIQINIIQSELGSKTSS